MRGTCILIVFFCIFTGVSIQISSPMFPGNLFCALIGGTVKAYTNVSSALLNGEAYEVSLWLIFLGIERKLSG